MQSDAVSQIIAAYDRRAGQLSVYIETLTVAINHLTTSNLLLGLGTAYR